MDRRKDASFYSKFLPAALYVGPSCGTVDVVPKKDTGFDLDSRQPMDPLTLVAVIHNTFGRVWWGRQQARRRQRIFRDGHARVSVMEATENGHLLEIVVQVVAKADDTVILVCDEGGLYGK